MKHLLNFGHFFETIGLLVKSNLVPGEIVLATWSDIIVWGWTQLEPVTAIFRNKQDPTSWQNFEYIAVLAQQWQQKHPTGTYPQNMPRLPLEYPYADADREYEASLEPKRA